MSLLIKGVTKLSQLAIDVAKNWAGQKIENIGAPAAQNDVIRADVNIRASDSSALEGSNKATVQDHTPKAHSLVSHSTKPHSALTDVTSSQHHAQSHSLASHSTKAHSELSDAPEGAHHTKFTTTEHSSIGNGAPHHTKYTDSSARSAAVSDVTYGAGWNGVTTIAPSKNAVYDKIETLGAADPGEGHITILPEMYNSIGQGTWSYTTGDNSRFVSFWQNSTFNNADEISYKVFLAQGTYTLRFIVWKTAEMGIVDVYIDAAEVASFDNYDAGIVEKFPRTQTNITVASSGIKTLKFKLDGKNGSSNNYKFYLELIALWRTA